MLNIGRCYCIDDFWFDQYGVCSVRLQTRNWYSTVGFSVISLGFIFLTIGILSGAVWANEAWGSYWNWYPKIITYKLVNSGLQ
ncbi:hypothetical protein DCAR_0625197 [Daucus carota subsp. sativus]|uniref:Cytochrome c assembly protein domain-containing protein n=1 Tax=Daucus carota subsp. sativus TaxID=79200 RepID=A0AAF0XG52_DAUCS|nr:hypothetical protein DCAR_0625197 [Daucus carota subsp. sativus]